MRTSTNPMDLATHDEASLLGAMAMQQRAAEDARAAWGELFVRHRRYLFVVASRAYGTLLGEEGVVDLVSDTFRRAYEWAGRQADPEQVREQFASPDPNATRRRVLGWLGAIAQSLFRDRFRDGADEATKVDEFHDDWRNAQVGEPSPSSAEHLEHLNLALATLSPTEADAVRASLPWYDPDTRSFNVPRGEALRLAQRLGTNPDTLRQRRHRALQRIEQYLQSVGYVIGREEAR